jgi:hypothetical protein
MARGFESKDVEFQQSEAERAQTLKRAISPEERERLARRRTVELSLLKARADLKAVSSAPHRRMLEQAIAALEAQLSEAQLSEAQSSE